MGLRPPPVIRIERLLVASNLLQESLRTKNALAPAYSCSKQCWVKGRKTVVDNTDKLEEAGTPYVQRIMLVPLVRPGMRAGPQRRQGHLCVGVTQDMCSVLVVIFHLKKGDTTGVAWEEPSCYKLINKGLEYSN